MRYRLSVLCVGLCLGLLGCGDGIELTPEQQVEFAYRHHAMMCELHRNLIIPKGPAKKVSLHVNGIRFNCGFDKHGRLSTFGYADQTGFKFTYGPVLKNFTHSHGEPKNATHQLALSSLASKHPEIYYYMGDGKTSLGQFKDGYFESDLHKLTFDGRNVAILEMKKSNETYINTWDGDTLVAIDKKIGENTRRAFTLVNHKFDEHKNLTHYTVTKHGSIVVEDVTVDVELKWEYR